MFLRTYFNSHPHEEDDVASFSSFVHVCISTHILTKRMTFVTVVVEFFHGYISTHILTKRMTRNRNHIHFSNNISTHILTKRMTVLRQITINRLSHFNSHPHEEDDNAMKGMIDTGYISTHILTKRMTYSWLLKYALTRYFNSHPHEEDDSNFKQK